jgi:hypothetical protein
VLFRIDAQEIEFFCVDREVAAGIRLSRDTTTMVRDMHQRLTPLQFTSVDRASTPARNFNYLAKYTDV